MLFRSPGGGRARVMLRQDGVATQSIDARIGVEEEMTFRLDRRGPSVLEIEVAPAPEELTLANNRAAVVVNGVRDRLRVLLVSTPAARAGEIGGASCWERG